MAKYKSVKMKKFEKSDEYINFITWLSNTNNFSYEKIKAACDKQLIYHYIKDILGLDPDAASTNELNSLLDEVVLGILDGGKASFTKRLKAVNILKAAKNEELINNIQANQEKTTIKIPKKVVEKSCPLNLENIKNKLHNEIPFSMRIKMVLSSLCIYVFGKCPKCLLPNFN